MSAGRVLIVDDDRDVRDMLAEYLTTHGYEVAQADGGAAMRTALERGVPDVVLLDVGLPGEDGLRSRGTCASATTSASSW